MSAIGREEEALAVTTVVSKEMAGGGGGELKENDVFGCMKLDRREHSLGNITGLYESSIPMTTSFMHTFGCLRHSLPYILPTYCTSCDLCTQTRTRVQKPKQEC